MNMKTKKEILAKIAENNESISNNEFLIENGNLTEIHKKSIENFIFSKKDENIVLNWVIGKK